jgi:hypothetical protein
LPFDLLPEGTPLHIPDADFTLPKFALDPAEAAQIVDRGECQRVGRPEPRTLAAIAALARTSAPPRPAYGRIKKTTWLCRKSVSYAMTDSCARMLQAGLRQRGGRARCIRIATIARIMGGYRVLVVDADLRQHLRPAS